MDDERASRAASGRAAVTAVLLVLGLTSCVPGAVDPDRDRTSSISTSSAAPGRLADDALASLAVTIGQSRSDWAARIVQVTVTNAGAEDVDVTGAVLTSSLFAGEAVAERERRVPAGTTRSLSVALGEPVCEPAAPSDPLGRAALTLADDAGRTSTLTITADDPRGHLARIHGEDCAARAVAAGARLTVADRLDTTESGGRLVGTLTVDLTPQPDGPSVQVTQIDGTVLLGPLGGASWSTPALTTAGDGAGATPDGPRSAALSFLPARCDAHAVAEDKRGTYLGVHATVDGVAQPVFYLGVPDDVRGAVHEYMGTACGWPVG